MKIIFLVECSPSLEMIKKTIFDACFFLSCLILNIGTEFMLFKNEKKSYIKSTFLRLFVLPFSFTLVKGKKKPFPTLDKIV